MIPRSLSAANDTSNDSEWIIDLEGGYEFDSGLGIYAGANNIGNTYPAEVSGAAIWATISTI